MSDTLSLNTLSESYHLRKEALADFVARKLVQLFSINVVGTVVLTVVLSAIDAYFIWYGKITPADRLISEKVFTMIVGATTVQLGIGVAAVIAALFKQSSSKSVEASEF